MHIAMATEPGTSGTNEDWCAATPNTAVVLDGVTARVETGCIHGVQWYVNHLGPCLVARLADEQTETTDALAGAIRDVAAMHAHSCDLSHSGTPSATVALLRQRADLIEYLVLADSTVVLETADGVQVVTDNRVDEVSRPEREQTSRYPVGSAEHEESIKRLQEAQVKRRNQPGGYWVAAANPQAAHEAITGASPLGEVKRAAILSDGASRLVDRYALATWTDVLDLLALHGPAEVIRRVREADEGDPAGSRWARYKRSDDATAISFES